MISRLAGAAQFLTILPVPVRGAPIGQSASFFPLIGAALGAAGAVVFQLSNALLPRDVAALLVISFWALITGGLHEDGFADVADAFRAGRSRDKILSILKDSRIGAHGALALLLISLVRWLSLAAIVSDPMTALPAIFAVSRASLAVLAWVTPPSGSGLGYEFSRSLTTVVTIGVILQALVWAYFSAAAFLLIWGASLILIGARAYFMRRIGGVTGDCLGATCLTIETWGLIVFACQRCM